MSLSSMLLSAVSSFQIYLWRWMWHTRGKMKTKQKGKLVTSYVYMDTNNRNKSLIKIRMRHVNTSFGRFWSDTSHWERIFILNERGDLCRSLFNRCPYTHLLPSCLPGWGKIFLAAHVWPMLPRQGSSWHFHLLSCDLYISYHGLNLCIITVTRDNRNFLLCNGRTLQLTLCLFVSLLLSIWKWGEHV